ncbi:hypothetical protein FRC0481_00325 [Corynebacterium diphtheriae]|nr:hypothetical protein FRC0481_00325 [Corynebacterium diphtheriae]CAB0949845.1 hypothetical protein FRC0480_00325 [Corynebacterium diphtheriae]
MDEGVDACESVSGVVDVDVLFWFSGVVEVGDGFAYESGNGPGTGDGLCWLGGCEPACQVGVDGVIVGGR